MMGDVSNSTSRECPSASGVSDLTGMFDSATLLLGTFSVMLNLALTAGSSQHGKHLRASVDSNWVTAMYRSSSSSALLEEEEEEKKIYIFGNIWYKVDLGQKCVEGISFGNL